MPDVFRVIDQAAEIAYDNASSGLSATTTQAAIDELAAGGAVDPSKEAAADLTAGQPVYIVANTLAKGQATTFASSQIVGLVTEDTLDGVAAPYRKDGRLTLEDWTAAAGAETLTVGSVYYLSAATAGRMTTVAPTTTGQRVVRIGRAIADDTMAIEIEPSILL